MTNLDISIHINRFKHYSESLHSTAEEETILLMIESFAHYLSRLYGDMIEESINSRRYEGKWEPVDEEGYIEYLGTTPSVPIIYLIRDALEVVKVGYNYVIRFNPDYKYPDTSLPLVKILRAIENGTSKFNARPILVKNARLIRNSTVRLWKGYLVRKGII